MVNLGRHNIRYNDTQHNITQHNDTQQNDTHHNDTQHNDTEHNDTQLIETQHTDTQYNDTQHNDTQLNNTRHIRKKALLSIRRLSKKAFNTVMLSVNLCLSVIINAEFHYVECRLAENHGAIFGTFKLS